MRLGFSVLLVSMLGLPLWGQVTAKQGTAQDLAQGEFTSPMVLELPLDRLQEEAPGGVYAFTDQARFVCEDVSLPLIVITKSTTFSKRIKLRIQATTFVRPSYDREVVVLASITLGAAVLKTLPELRFSAEEKKYQSDSSTVELSKEEFESLFRGDPRGKLKLVMTVTPDR